MSPLGNAGAIDCANYCISLFSDLTKYVTMQNLFHDGGFSSTGVTTAVMDRFGEERVPGRLEGENSRSVRARHARRHSGGGCSSRCNRLG